MTPIETCAKPKVEGASEKVRQETEEKKTRKGNQTRQHPIQISAIFQEMLASIILS